ncbi:hypothetical protein SPRG_13838 [Saprolegnia parasitica CBS 223.65]|uniref:FYVE-type domain-containing protein n=1 Tax=Saprolegnia parasitica (strain CBS 223.65) TaxID=695850 RepID=A0A067C2L5_SAPPC|nr:hypothetical protein SPRG_13838 [Saprolegnia parasitica CBS 223.65]KDO21047.1 hypothetical protein SPRG_13838 [Saprolegnia parasitica CBS 223.65]|eukprot:XP_012208227.1 hypothetical protein SPRG_13838 [Saprolegnia parasitica CBS 223.65]
MTKRQYPLPADYFRCPALTHDERAYFIQLGDKTFHTFLEKTVTKPDPSLEWRSAGRQHGVKLLEAHSTSGHRFDHGILPFRAIAKVTGTIEEVAALHDFDTRDKCLTYMNQYDSMGDVLDIIPLYTFIERSADLPSLHQVYVKWVACASPVPMIHDRDYLYIETQNEFILESGQRGWAYCQHSITLPSVPPLRNHTGLNLVRGSLYHTGCVFLESETPGVLEVTYHIASDFKGAMPQWVRRLGLKRRATNVAKVNDFIHEQRLSACRMRTQLECRPTLHSKHCHLCDRSFALRRPRNCHACGEVVCSRCSKPWRLSGIFRLGPATVCVCHACSSAVRDGTSLHFSATDGDAIAEEQDNDDNHADDNDRPSIIIISSEPPPRQSSLSRRSSFSRARPSIQPSRKPSRRNSIKGMFRPSTSTISYVSSSNEPYVTRMHQDFLDVASTTETVDLTRLKKQLQTKHEHDALEAMYRHMTPGLDRFVDTGSDVDWTPETTKDEAQRDSSPSTVDLSYLNEIYRHTLSSSHADSDSRYSYWESEPPILDYRKSRVSEYDPSRRSAYDELNALVDDVEESKEETAGGGFRVHAPPGTTMYPLPTKATPEAPGVPAPTGATLYSMRPVHDSYGFATPFTIAEEAMDSLKSSTVVKQYELDGLELTDESALSSLNTSRSYQESVLQQSLDDDMPTSAADDGIPYKPVVSNHEGVRRLLAELAKQQQQQH